MIRYQLFQYPLPAPPDLADLNAWLSTHRVVSVQHHVVTTGQGSLLVFLVQTAMGAPEAGPGQPAGGRVDYKEVLGEADFALFSRLREERKRIAQTEGLPVFAVFTNEQLAEMVTRKAATIAELLAIPGIGRGRIEKYAEVLLQILRLAPSAASVSNQPAAKP